MAQTATDYGFQATARTEGSGSVLTDHPDMRMVQASFLVPLLVLIVGAIIYFLPIDTAIKVASSPLIAVFILTLVYSVSSYDELAKAEYIVTPEYIESRTGMIEKKVRSIPLSYVRDVTHDQNFFQRVFEVSSIIVSPTNGDKIVFCNIRDGKSARERIWNLVLSRSPREKRTT